MRAALGVFFALMATEAMAADVRIGQGPPVRVGRGEQITLADSDDSKMRVDAVEPAKGMREGRGAPRGETQEHLYTADATFSAATGTLVFSLRTSPDRGAALKLENGLSRRVIYSAEVVFERNGQSVVRPTTICSVAPVTVGVEEWVEDLTEVRITALYVLPPGEMVCGYPERGEFPTLPMPLP